MSLAEGPVAPLAIRLLGPFEVLLNGAGLPRPRTRKGQWLLALLALRHDCDVERAWLAGTLWPGSTPDLAFYNLRRELIGLRKALGEERFHVRSPTARTLRLDLAGAAVDVLDFDTAIARGDARSLEVAVALYRGPLLEGCKEEWVYPERQAREQAYLAALEALAVQAIARGDVAVAEGRLRRVVAVDPLRESAQRALMRTLAAGGNRAAATKLYRDLRLLLHRELNEEPDPETAAIFHRIHVPPRAWSPSPATDADRPTTSDERPPSLLPSVVGGRWEFVVGRPPAAAPWTGEETVTFLFTDIEGSTELWDEQPEAMRQVLSRLDALVHHAIEAHLGTVFQTVGDQFCAAFASVPNAIGAALAAQRSLLDCRLAAGDADDEAPVPKSAISSPRLRVRMALHTGTAEEREADYFGSAVDRVARLLEAGHGSQILLSLVTQELAREQLPEGASLRDLGEHRLGDLARPERVFQLVHPALPADFPTLRSLAASIRDGPPVHRRQGDRA